MPTGARVQWVGMYSTRVVVIWLAFLETFLANYFMSLFSLYSLTLFISFPSFCLSLHISPPFLLLSLSPERKLSATLQPSDVCSQPDARNGDTAAPTLNQPLSNETPAGTDGARNAGDGRGRHDAAAQRAWGDGDDDGGRGNGDGGRDTGGDGEGGRSVRRTDGPAGSDWVYVRHQWECPAGDGGPKPLLPPCFFRRGDKTACTSI